MIKVGTYNVLHPYYATRNPVAFLPSGGSNWSEREATICQNLIQADLDVFGLQEISEHNFQTLKQRLGPTYTAIYQAHQPNADGVALFFKTQRFSLERQSSPVYTHSLQTRCSLLCDLKDRQTQRTYQVASTHLFGGPHRQRGDSQLAHLLNALSTTSACATILIGDFNEDQFAGSNSRLATMQASGFQHDGSHQESEIGRNRRIDWIFVKSPLAPLTIQSLALNGQTNASDHRLVASQIQLTPATTFSQLPTSLPLPGRNGSMTFSQLPTVSTLPTSPLPPNQKDSAPPSQSYLEYFNPLKWLQWLCDWIKVRFS